MSKSNDFFSLPSIHSFGKDHSPQDESPSQRELMIRYIPLVLGFLLLILGSLYFLSDYSTVETLSVEGTNEVLDQEVIQASEVRSGDRLWGTYGDKESIEEQIVSTLPQVSQVEMSFSGVNDFTFEIEEYNTVAYVLEENHYRRVLENGTVLEAESSTSLGNYPVFIGFEEGDDLNRMIEQFDKVEPTVQDLVSEVEHVENERNPMLVRAYMNNGNQVLASIPSFADRMNYYPQMVQAVDGQYGLFDLEAGAFFIPFVDNDPDEAELEEDAEVDIEEE